MNNKKIIELLKYTSESGCDKVELFLEDATLKTTRYSNNTISSISNSDCKGLGITIFDDNKSYHGSINNITRKNLYDLADKLTKNVKKGKNIMFTVGKLKKVNNNKNNDSLLITMDKKKKMFNFINNMCMNYDKRITSVIIRYNEEKKIIRIINNVGANVKEIRYYNRLFVSVISKDNNKQESANFSYGSRLGFNEINNKEMLSNKIKQTCNDAIESLYAIECPAGAFPVIIGNDFGGVLFHEACGHSLEATSVHDDTSVLSKLKGKQIASKKVTLIDDGTIKGIAGTTYFDDEGYKTKKRILIKNGILNEYLVNDNLSKKMNEMPNCCGRRQSYFYPTTSRMSNTYLKPGKDSLEDMIKSIKYGIYAKQMGGGSVTPATGDFNFSVKEAYLIENGKISSKVKGASLIGNSKDLLMNVEMVSNDLSMSDGLCGSISGNVRVTCGMPSVKISKMLVGGTKTNE